MSASGDDEGRANERTALAWQRTALGIALAATMLARLTADQLDAAELILVGSATGMYAWVLAQSRGRYRHHARLTDGRRTHRAGGAAATLTIGILTLAVVEILVLVQA